MYQFMVITTRSGASFVSSGNINSTATTRDENATLRATTGGEIPTMSLTSGTNKWASRAVVALQLAAWSAVGIVLLEKGITTLQRTNSTNDDARANNVTQHQVTSTTTTGGPIESNNRSGNVLSVIPLIPIDVINVQATTDIDYSGSSNDSTTSNSVTSLTTEVPNLTNYSSTIYNKIPITQQETQSSTSGDEKNFIVGINKNVQSTRSNELLGGRESNDQSRTKDPPVRPRYQNSTQDESSPALEPRDREINVKSSNEETTGSSQTETKEQTMGTSENSKDSSLNIQKRLRIAQINGSGGGAAAAVAMVAVGAVMLILGPVVIVLRALDERRQERRFLKLSGEDDLPPSYEQATGSIEQAPTYSSLNLDTIESSTSSSPSNNTALLS